MAFGIANKFGHSLTLSRKIEEMQQENSGQDFIIEVEGQKFPVHRMLLIACSDYFKAMLSIDMQESNEGIVHMEGMKSESVKICLEYMYTGEAPVNMDNIRGVMYTADMWQYQELTDQCLQYLEQQITINHCLDVKFIAEEFSIAYLANIAEQYVVENFDRIINSNGFKALTVYELLNLIEKSREQTKVIWNTVISWVKTSGEDELSEELFHCFDFTGCSFKFLYKTVWKEPLIAKNEGYRIIVAEKLLPLVTAYNLTTTNCFEFLELAKSRQDQACTNRVYRYLAKNLEDVIPSLDSLDRTDVTEIFLLCNWNEDAQHLWSVFRKRVKDFENRKSRIQVLGILKKCVLPSSDFNFLYSTLLRDSLIKSSSVAIQLVLSELFKKTKYCDVSGSNWLRLLVLTRKNALHRIEARKIIVKYITENLQVLLVGTDFQKITEDLFPEIIASTARATSVKLQYFAGRGFLKVEYRLHDEADIWNAVRVWVTHDKKNRKCHFEKLVESMNLQWFSFDFLYETLYKDPLVREATSVKQYVATMILRVAKPSDLTTSNCFDLLQCTTICYQRDSPKAKEKIIKFIGFNFQEVCREDEFVSLSCDNFLQVLQSIDSNCNEKDKWDGSIKWVRANPEARKDHLPTILKEVELKKMSRTFIRSNVFSDSLVKKSEVCKTLIIEALLVHDFDDTENEQVDLFKQQKISRNLYW